jgi:MYXO-CTERM domain-containing protein
MKSFLPSVQGILLAGLLAGAASLQAEVPIRQEQLFFPALIEGRVYRLEAMLYRPDDSGRHPLVVFSHGRNGMASPRDPSLVLAYAALCRQLAADGHVVAYIIRRGYGNSDGPDAELQDTAVLSGLEASKDYQAAVEYWRTMDFVLPDNIVLVGQSQGGWAVLACTNVAMPGVLGVVNISGGTNYRLMGTGAVTAAVQDAWVAGAGELGAGARVPSFWVYAENDQSISGPTALRMFSAYTNARGWGSMLMLPAYGNNGHGIVSSPDLFHSQLQDYFTLLGFEDATGVRRELPPGSGATIVNLAATTPTTPTPPAPPPANSPANSTGGGGGGAPSAWFLAALVVLTARRMIRRQSRARSAGGAD